MARLNRGRRWIVAALFAIAACGVAFWSRSPRGDGKLPVSRAAALRAAIDTPASGAANERPDAPRAPAGREGAGDRAAASFASVMRGAEIELQPFIGEALRGRVNLVQIDRDATVRIGGELAGRRGSFAFGERDGALTGFVLLPEERVALVVSRSTGGGRRVERRPLGAVVCDPLPPEPSQPAAIASDGAAAAVPVLSSRPGATAVLYLDFDGETVNDPFWNSGRTIVAAASALSGAQVTEVWNSVREDFAAFDIDVTTDVARYNSAPVGRRMRCIITPTSNWYGLVGGVAFIDCFKNAGNVFSSTVPCWVFNTSVNGVAEAVSHEFGHTLGLLHDGDLNQPAGSTGREYYYGHGSGATSWGPIMGASYGRSVVQWSKGEYPGANNQEDDIAIIASTGNRFGFVADEAGGARATAAPLGRSGNTIAQAGVISSSADGDFYTLTLTGPSSVTLSATPAAVAPDLDIALELQDAAGTVLASNNPDGALGASLAMALASGTYYVKLQGAGRGSASAEGYSSYGSIGEYSLAGTIAVVNVPDITRQPVAQTIVVGQSVTFSVTATGGGTLAYQWQKDGVALTSGGRVSGATSASLTITSVQNGDAGNYRVVVSNVAGPITSASALLTVLGPPAIAMQPVARTASTGATATFSVAATGTAPTYTWQRLAAGGGAWVNVAGSEFSGAETATLTINPVTSAMQADQFRCVVANSLGTATSSAVALTVTISFGAAQLAADGTHSMVLKRDGTVWAMGQNASGQLGDGTTTPRLAPVQIATGALAIATAGVHALLIKSDRSLWATGGNAAGQLGDGSRVTRLAPVRIASNVVAAAAGEQHTLFVTAEGTLWGAGDNVSGQLGLAAHTTFPAPTPLATNVARVAAGANHSLFVKNDGTLWGMGINASGQLGDANPATRYSPIQIASGVTAASAGHDHTLFLKADGTLWAVGENRQGQLGDGTATSRQAPVPVATNVALCSAGTAHSVFVKKDGTLWAMGFNAVGEVGDGTTAQRNSPVQIATGVATAAAGDYYTLFAKTDGTLWVVGKNDSGELGDGTALRRLAPVEIIGSGAQTPPPPTGLAASDGTRSEAVRVTWSAVLGATGYDVFRASANQPELAITLASGLTTTIYDDATAIGGATYFYFVRASNAAGGGMLSLGDSGFRAGAAPPLFVSEPQNAIVTLGGNAVFTVFATGAPAPAYRWQRRAADAAEFTDLAEGAAFSGTGTATLVLSGFPAGFDRDEFRCVAGNSHGTAISAVARLTITSGGETEPVITSAASATFIAGWQGRFTVTATGAAPLRFNGDGTMPSWLAFDWVSGVLSGTPPAGTTGPIAFALTAINSSGQTTQNFTLHIASAPTPPVFTQQPLGVSAMVTEAVTLSAAATGSPAPAYQWRKNGAPIAGATAATLALASLELADAGDYTLVATNTGGVTVSAPATLAVSTGQAILGLAGRSEAGAAELSAAFTLEGALPKRMLARAVGPTLAALGAGGMLVDPRLEVFDAHTGTRVAVNDDWELGGDADALRSASAAVGAFPLALGGRDAALLATLAPGTYRARVRASSLNAGAALLEVYEANGWPRTRYAAARGTVTAGGDFVLQLPFGAAQAGRTYVARALGPALGQSGALANPELRVFAGTSASGTPLASNDDWNPADEALAAALEAVGAMPLPPGSKDAAVLFTPTGATAYTLQARGVGQTAGAVWLELFENDAGRPVAGRPAVVVPPSPASITVGQDAILGVVAIARPASNFQWRRNGTALPGATRAQLVLAQAAAADAGDYDVVVSNTVGTATSPAAALAVAPAAVNAATQAFLGGGYEPGSTITIINTLTFAALPTHCEWSVVLPAGWTLASDFAPGASARPAAGAAGALVWKWDAFGGTSLAFSYALHVPASETLTRPLSANLTVVSGATQAVAVRPESLMIAPRLVHGADTDGDFRISLFELTRVIELYNTRRGTVRTGAYAVTTVETEDGFAADATRTLNAGQTLSRYHSADTNRDGCIALGELLRMIELYNYRAATVRTGQYHAAAGTEDGFTPGP